LNILTANLFSKNKTQKIKKIALLVSTNYKNTNYELKGCTNDTRLIYNLLIENFNYTKENINLLTDYTIKSSTKNNIMDIFQNIVNESNNIDTIFIYFSGHGNNKGILLNNDEVLFNYEFKDNLLDKISKDTKIIIIFDCCKSGNYIDTKFISNINFYILNLKILFLSACNEIQNTTEIYINKEKMYYGIFTYFLNYIIKKYRQISWSELMYILKLLINKTNKNQDPNIKTINYNSLDDIIKI
jgi:hypothetical protein